MVTLIHYVLVIVLQSATIQMLSTQLDYIAIPTCTHQSREWEPYMAYMT